MSNRRTRSSDPRNLPGDIAGPGGPHDFGAVVLDASRAVIMDEVTVSTIDFDRAGKSGLAMLLGGRINQTQDRAKVLFLFGSDGAAAICTQLMAVIGRASGPEVAAEFVADLIRRMDELQAEGNLT
jgi:hypothetical protein